MRRMFKKGSLLSDSGAMSDQGRDILRAAALLREGNLVAIPTETVYGLAADIRQEKAIHNIFRVKGRSFQNPLIVHVGSPSSLEDGTWISSFPSPLRKLSDIFWPGPLTLLLPKTAQVPRVVCAGLPRVAVRVPSHPRTQALLSELSSPLVAPSANLSGHLSPTLAEHIHPSLREKISYVLEGGKAEKGLESTVVGMLGDKVCIYRLGSLTSEELEEVLGYSVELADSVHLASPGGMAHHYAPLGKSLVLGSIPSLLSRYPIERSVVISFQELYTDIPADRCFVLSPRGDLEEASQKWFEVLHRIEQMSADWILVDLFPEVALGRTLNDRIRRALRRETRFPQRLSQDLC
ncbi:MAG: L-threonylcarbamoyladenylate synthase [Cytophagales bacterium]|nr:L-threonylcarbamoyladenylate synthase [Cytophagales bacterium]